MKTIQDIPVLFFPFSRPQYAHQVFEAIKKSKPKRFYFYCDKAREGNEDELRNNNIIREYVKEVDWDCELKTWFRDENVGVFTSILNAIDWFFENEEMGIILEEDCLPSLAFFDFCKQLLPKYAEDRRVWYIGGNNLIEGYNPNGYDYIFTHFAYQWGWATWKTRWESLNRQGFNVDDIISYDLYRMLYGSKKSAESAYKFLHKVQDSDGLWRPKSWDFMFNMTMRCNGGFGIAPTVNLVSNIGVVGTHSSSYNKATHNLKIPNNSEYNISKHPPFVVVDFKYNNMFWRKRIKNNSSLIKRVKNKILKLFQLK